LQTPATFDAEPAFAGLIQGCGLTTFDAWWTLPVSMVEPGNQGRGGWSNVGYHKAMASDGSTLGLYVKRQQDHVYRSWRHPLRGRPTGQREFRVLRRCREIGIPAAGPVLYAERRLDGHVQGVLVTQELAGYRALDDEVADWLRLGRPPGPQRRRLLRAIAALVTALHGARFEHGCLYPKHLMIHTDWLAGGPAEATPAVALIDLEKCKRRWRRSTCTLRDLDTLNRHSLGWSRTDRGRFLGWYLGAGPRLSARGRRLWQRLARRAVAGRRLQSVDTASSTA
jgi:hypothetical protein